MTRHLKSLIALLALAAIETGCAHQVQANAFQEETHAHSVSYLEAHFQAIGNISHVVHTAIHSPSEEEIGFRERFIEAVAKQDWERAKTLSEFYLAEQGDDRGKKAETAFLIHDGQLQRAREQAWNAMSEFPDDFKAWQKLWYESFFQDGSLWHHEPVALERKTHFDSLRSLGGGTTVTVRVVQNDETIAVFKPHSQLRQTYYRGEVAAYRLCELMRCSFQVPVNTEVKIKLQDFLSGYGINSLRQGSGYARRFSDIILFRDADGSQWIHGTLKEWVPGFTTFPVEHTDGWTPLVNGRTSRQKLDSMSLEDALRPMRGKERNNVGGMLERGGNTTGLGFATQLSDMHVFDFLLNNWDRYSGIYWGANCQWNHGRFVSIDNGAVLQPKPKGHGTATRDRLQRIRVFSKESVEAIRRMDFEMTKELLLPDNQHHEDEDQRFEHFWDRRAWFLEWVDSLIEKYGEENVLALP